ncbi:MAG: M56 family metallopeptidase [Planctomycetota bacterium]|nr:M56 family metallopeptidase [Planctomycetota bacterium]MDA1178456.1 M56 family metallopeptidase [Planctomycetota bacterium]
MVIESLLFFNPAVWWLSRQVRIEREACCDALAAEVCGQPLSVARALVEVASVVTGQAHIAAALAFTEPAKEGELTDRVRRLVDPDQAPRSKVSWLCLGAVFLALAATAVLLQRGTDLAVRAAAEWMSPKERIEKLVELEAERNGNIIPLAEVSPGSPGDNFPTPSNSPPADPNEGKIAVLLIVKTDDGSEISPKLSLSSVSAVSRSSSNSTLNSPQEAVPEHRLTLHYPPCHLQFIASQPGRATMTSPVITLLPTDREKTIELILTKGSPVDVAVRNEQGQPISHAWVQQTTPIKLRRSTSSSGNAEQQADEHGRLRFEHIGNTEQTFHVLAPGYQRLQFEHTFGDPSLFTREDPLVITLKAARPTPVRVIDAVTNQPVKDARFRVAYRQTTTYSYGHGFSRHSLTPNRWSDYGITDEAGHASLDELEDGAMYTFAVFVDGYGIGVLETKSGQPEHTVRLSPPLKIAGRVTGSIERLPKRSDPKNSGYFFTFGSRLGEHIRDNQWADVDDEGRFMLEGYSAGEQLTLNLPDERRDIVLKESVTDLEFDIKPVAGPTSYPKREVVIRLTGTAQEAPARGSLYVSWQHPTIRAEPAQNGPLPVRGNEVRFSALVGAQLFFQGEDLVGYRITEQNKVEIVAGTEPQVIEVSAVAAGGIHGSITRADGSLAQSAFVTVFVTKLPSGEKDHGRINPSGSSGGPQYLRNLPLGGRYIMLAREQTPTGYSWAVSDEVTIDESHPITQADIKRPTGRDLQVKVLDDAGKPVVGQEIQLEIGFRQKKPDTGFSFHITSETDSLGFATFENLSMDQPLGPVELTLFCTAKPNPFRGSTTKVNSSKLIELRLTRGVSASGVLIDSATNKPIPNANVRIYPRHFDQAIFKQSVTTDTDTNGRFHFEGLEPIEYSGHVDNTSPKGTIVTAHGGGGFSFSYPAGVEQHGLTAGAQGKPVRWEVTIHPGSRLRPAE